MSIPGAMAESHLSENVDPLKRRVRLHLQTASWLPHQACEQEQGNYSPVVEYNGENSFPLPISDDVALDYEHTICAKSRGRWELRNVAFIFPNGRAVTAFTTEYGLRFTSKENYKCGNWY